MLLASAPFREWSLLSSRPTSRAHDRSLCQGNPTGREAGLDMHLQVRCMSRSVPHFHAQFTRCFTTQYVFTQCGLTAHLHSIETLICWLSFFNLQDVKLDQCRTPIKGCHSTMPTMCPWGRTKKSATHQNIYHLPPIIRQHAGRQCCMMQSACLT